MKKSYTDKKRTSVALDPELTKRIEKVLKTSNMKLSKYAQEAIKKELENDEIRNTIKFWNKLNDSSQYQKIKQLEGEVEKLKEYHITEKKTTELFKKLKSKKIDDLEKRLVSYESVNEYIIHHYLPTIKKNVKEYKKWLKKNE